jgi:hypothetical protein
MFLYNFFRRFLWGRADDESCLKDLQDQTNSSALAQVCGIYSRSIFYCFCYFFVVVANAVVVVAAATSIVLLLLS